MSEPRKLTGLGLRHSVSLMTRLRSERQFSHLSFVIGHSSFDTGSLARPSERSSVNGMFFGDE